MLGREQKRASWTWQEQILWIFFVTVWGGLGSLLDSSLGGWLQASVIDNRTGKVVEGRGGRKVSPRRRILRTGKLTLCH